MVQPRLPPYRSLAQEGFILRRRRLGGDRRRSRLGHRCASHKASRNEGGKNTCNIHLGYPFFVVNTRPRHASARRPYATCYRLASIESPGDPLPE